MRNINYQDAHITRDKESDTTNTPMTPTVLSPYMISYQLSTNRAHAQCRDGYIFLKKNGFNINS